MNGEDMWDHLICLKHKCGGVLSSQIYDLYYSQKIVYKYVRKELNKVVIRTYPEALTLLCSSLLKELPDSSLKSLTGFHYVTSHVPCNSVPQTVIVN